MKRTWYRNFVAAIIVSASAVGLQNSFAMAQSSTAKPGEKDQPKSALVFPPPKSVEEECGCEGAAAPEVFAVVNGVRITRKDIDEPIQDQIEKLRQQVIDARKRELNLQVNSRLLDTEAKRRGISATQLLQDEVISKVKEPDDADAQVFFEQNQGMLSGEFKDLKDSILRHLKKQRESQEAKKLADRLRASADVKTLVREATPPSNEADRSRVFATVSGYSVTSADVENALAPLVSHVQEQIYTMRKNELESRISEVLLQQEAIGRKITTRALHEEEVTPKVRKVTDADVRDFYEKNKERISGAYEQLKPPMVDYVQKMEGQKAEVAYAQQLREKAKIEVYLIPPPLVRSISTDDQLAKDSELQK